MYLYSFFNLGARQGLSGQRHVLAALPLGMSRYPLCLCITPFILLYVCNLSSKPLLCSDTRYPRYLKSVTCSIKLSFITIFTLCMWFKHIAIDFVFVLDMVILCKRAWVGLRVGLDGCGKISTHRDSMPGPSSL